MTDQARRRRPPRGKNGGRTVALLVATAFRVGTVSTVATSGVATGGGDTSVTYTVVGETAGGWCMPQAQLASNGIQVAVAIYDTLTTQNSKGEIVPYLAKSITPNATFDEWTIGLHEGIEFHDGTPVDADAVKLNLDSYAGRTRAFPARLGIFTYENIATSRSATR